MIPKNVGQNKNGTDSLLPAILEYYFEETVDIFKKKCI